MGFGTLFLGYFLLLNVTYFGYTDLIAGLIMVMALYKLMTVNRQFKIALYLSGAFSVFGVIELFVTVFSMFSPAFKEEAVLLYVTPIRYLVIALLTAFILLGIRDVAAEVGLKPLYEKARLYVYVSVVAFLLIAIFDLPLMSFIPTEALMIISVFLLLAIFFIVLINLTIIYKAYMKICMPSELVPKKEQPSKYGFVNKFREHEAEKHREYAEYKLSKLQKKASKNKKKGKKK